VLPEVRVILGARIALLKRGEAIVLDFEYPIEYRKTSYRI